MNGNHACESSLTLLEGTPVVDAGGQMRGRVADVAVGTGADAGRVLALFHAQFQERPQGFALTLREETVGKLFGFHVCSHAFDINPNLAALRDCQQGQVV